MYLATAFLFFLAAACGCRRDPPRTREEILNSPLSPSEARTLMLEVDRKGAELGWPEEVLRNVRQRMRGRLRAAGVPDARIEHWVASAALTNQAKAAGEADMRR
jgi:hypothetical protein